MIPINDIFDFLIMAGVLTLAVLAAVARRRIFRSNERVKIRPSDWLVLSAPAEPVQRQMRVPTKVTKQK
jgi:hypothetical protein